LREDGFAIDDRRNQNCIILSPRFSPTYFEESYYAFLHKTNIIFKSVDVHYVEAGTENPLYTLKIIHEIH